MITQASCDRDGTLVARLARRNLGLSGPRGLFIVKTRAFLIANVDGVEGVSLTARRELLTL